MRKSAFPKMENALMLEAENVRLAAENEYLRGRVRALEYALALGEEIPIGGWTERVRVLPDGWTRTGGKRRA